MPRHLFTLGCLTLLGFAGAASAQAPTLGNCTVFPADNIWNTPIDQLPVSPNSSTYVNTIGAATGVHADFGSGLWDGGPIGIPFVTVPGTQTKYPASFTYASESDPGPYAVPLNAPIQGGSASTGDRHVISIDVDDCILYEMYAAYPQTASWQAGSGAIYNFLSNNLRVATWTSADAAGLPLFPAWSAMTKFLRVRSGMLLSSRSPKPSKPTYGRRGTTHQASPVRNILPWECVSGSARISISPAFRQLTRSFCVRSRSTA